MIAILSDSVRESAALSALCEEHRLPCYRHASLAEFRRWCARVTPRVVLTRNRLPDGCSDDVLSLLNDAATRPPARVVVLVAAGFPARLEARQISLGADCVLRDPVRTEVLLAYLGKFSRAGGAEPEGRNPAPVPGEFCGLHVYPKENRLARGARSVRLSPREMDLVHALMRSEGEVATYPALYADLFHRRFDGSTSNLRVLLGKLAASTRRVGIDIRRHIRVIPKTGYHYIAPPARGR